MLLEEQLEDAAPAVDVQSLKAQVKNLHDEIRYLSYLLDGVTKSLRQLLPEE